jgi:hypothetical protein
LRRLAYLKLRKGVKAAIDSQKITAKTGAYWTLSNPGILGRNPPGPLYALSYLGLARAEALSGDVAGSRKAYQDLFTLWKDADPDLAILSQARKEYAALQ